MNKEPVSLLKLSKAEFQKLLLEIFDENFGDTPRMEKSWWADVGAMADHKWWEFK